MCGTLRNHFIKPSEQAAAPICTVNIIAFEFQIRVDPEHVEPLEDVEHDEAREAGPDGDGDEAHDVPAEADEGLRRPSHQDAVEPGLWDHALY